MALVTQCVLNTYSKDDKVDALIATEGGVLTTYQTVATGQALQLLS